jgi:CDP-diacylglycerol--serine O-phosphatidyltransferase
MSYNKTREISLIKLFPNFVTALGLCFGISSIRLAMFGKFELAVAFIFIATIIDALDGGFARMLNAQSTFGEIFDSLSDFVNFGFCPVFIIYLWNIKSVRFFGWSIVLLCVISMAIRLARFNANTNYDKHNNIRSKFFFGVPAPVSAILVLFPLILSFEFDSVQEFLLQHQFFVIVYLVIIALLTVSTIPTFSLKKIKIKEKFITPIMILFSVFIIALFMERWKTILFMVPMYIVSIPISYLKYKKLMLNEKSNSFKQDV